MTWLKKNAWLQLLLISLLAIGLSTGCEELTDDDELDLGAAIPTSMQGTWVLFASAESNGTAIYDITSFVDISVTLDEGSFEMNIDGDVSTGNAGYLQEGGLTYLVFEEDGDLTQIQVLASSDNVTLLEVEVGGGEPDQIWAMSRGVGIFAGIVTVSGSNSPLVGATVTVVDNDDQSTVATVTTGAWGVYATGTLTTDDYTVTATLDGYEDEPEIVANSGLEATYVNFYMTEGTGGGGTGTATASYELWWASTSTADYDFYMKTPEIGGTVYTVGVFSSGSLENVPYVYHTGDETDGPGPEILQVGQFVSGTYNIYASRWSGDSFNEATASVLVKDASGNTTQTVTAPVGTDNYWIIGTVDGSTGAFTVVNEISSTHP